MGQSVAIRPLPISKLNTVVQIVMVAATLLAEGLRLDWPVLDAVLITTVAASTLASLGAYIRQLARGR
jgi:cardiolipin synthase